MLKTFSVQVTTSLDSRRVWTLLTDIENWVKASNVYAEVAWSGTPWEEGSCITGTLNYPQHLKYRYVLQKIRAGHEIAYLAHSLEPGLATHRIVSITIQRQQEATSIKITSYVLGESAVGANGSRAMKMLSEKWLKDFVTFCNQQLSKTPTTHETESEVTSLRSR